MSRDAASTHTLEAVIVVIIMIVAFVSVNTFDVSPSSFSRVEEIMKTRVRDTIRGWDETPIPDAAFCTPKTKLEQLVSDGLEGSHATWTTSVGKHYGPAYDTDLIIDNTAGHLPLHGSGTVMGTSIALPWLPDASYSLPSLTVGTASGTEHVIANAPALAFSKLIRPQGEATRLRAHYTSASGEGTLTAWGITAVPDASLEHHSREFGTNLSWRSQLNAVELSQTVLAAGASSGRYPLALWLKSEPTASADGLSRIHPIGATIDIQFPPGWEASWDAIYLPPWSGSVESTPAGPRLRAWLPDGTDAARTFRITASAPASPLRPFEVITARASNGSLAESNLVVQFQAGTERGLPRVLAPTTPYAMRLGSSGLFGAAIANGGDDMYVREVHVEIPGGYDLDHNRGRGSPMFEAIDYDPDRRTPSDAEGNWSVVDARHLRWVSHDPDGFLIPAGGAAFWSVGVRVTSDARHATGVIPAGTSGPNATITFSNGFTMSSSSWGKVPGVVSFRVPPATRADDDELGPTNDGYPWETAFSPGETRSFTTRNLGSLGAPRNTSTYTLGAAGSDVVSFEHAMANASLTVTERLVPVGKAVHVTADLSSMMTKLSELGVGSTLELDLYAPPSLGCKPTRSWSIDTADLPHPSVTTSVVWDGGTGLPSAFVGTDDGLVHRLDATGFPVWSTRVAGVPSALEPFSHAGSHGLIVGSLTGKLQRLDPADGSVEWTRTVASGGASESITQLEYDAARVRIGAGTSLGRLSLFAPNGDFITTTLLATGGPITTIRSSSGTNDAIYVTNPTTVHRYAPDLATAPATFTAKTYALGLGTAGVWIAEELQARRLDFTTLAPHVMTVPFDVETRIATAGEATGDPVEDLVVAHANMSFTVVDGSNGDTRWRRFSDWTYVGRPPTINSILGGGMGSFTDCDPVDHPSTFLTQLACDGAYGDGPHILVARDGHTTIVYRNGIPIIEQYDLQGTMTWTKPLPEPTTPNTLAAGEFATSSHATLYGDNEGLAQLRADDGTTLFSSTPSDRAGRFSLYAHVPEGGFFGTYLLVATLRWTLPVTGATQEASLLEWFEVVAPDGEPVATPHYRLALTVSQRDAPIADPRLFGEP